MKKWFLLLVGALTFACASQSESFPSPSDVDLITNNPSQQISDCEENEKRACHVTLGQHEGVVSCFVGIQKCIDDQ